MDTKNNAAQGGTLKTQGIADSGNKDNTFSRNNNNPENSTFSFEKFFGRYRAPDKRQSRTG
jgi:hypothetical protein